MEAARNRGSRMNLTTVLLAAVETAPERLALAGPEPRSYAQLATHAAAVVVCGRDVADCRQPDGACHGRFLLPGSITGETDEAIRRSRAFHE